MSDRRKKSLGRDPFADDRDGVASGAVKRLIQGKAGGRSAAREVSVTVKLTPANLKHLDAVREKLAARGREGMTRDELIRVAITLLSPDDIG